MRFKSKQHAVKYYQTIIDNPYLWPKCQSCGDPISFEPNKKLSKKQWLKTMFCSRQCSNAFRAQSEESKTCACGAVFYREQQTKNQNWRLRTKCGSCKKGTPISRESRINTKGDPVKKGFYVFEHSRLEFNRTGGKINCIDPVLIEIRDKRIDAVIAGLS